MAGSAPRYASQHRPGLLGGWCLRAALLMGATAALLGLAHLFAWLSRAQIDYLVS